jgi:hypothetical protein
MSYIDIEHLFVSFIECNDPTDTLRVRKIHYSLGVLFIYGVYVV